VVEMTLNKIFLVILVSYVPGNTVEINQTVAYLVYLIFLGVVLSPNNTSILHADGRKVPDGSNSDLRQLRTFFPDSIGCIP
jgi:hypothetical protein